MDLSIQEIIEEVKYLQHLRPHVTLSFEKEIVQVVTETHSVLYEMAKMKEIIEIDWRYNKYKIQKSKLAETYI